MTKPIDRRALLAKVLLYVGGPPMQHLEKLTPDQAMAQVLNSGDSEPHSPTSSSVYCPVPGESEWGSAEEHPLKG